MNTHTRSRAIRRHCLQSKMEETSLSPSTRADLVGYRRTSGFLQAVSTRTLAPHSRPSRPLRRSAGDIESDLTEANMTKPRVRATTVQDACIGSTPRWTIAPRHIPSRRNGGNDRKKNYYVEIEMEGNTTRQSTEYTSLSGNRCRSTSFSPQK